MTGRVLLAMVGVILALNEVNYGLFLLCGFDAVLRAIEMTTLRSGALFELDGSVLIHLGVCKAGHLDNRDDPVHIFDKKLVTICKKFLKKKVKRADFPLVSCGVRLCKVIEKACDLLRLGKEWLQLYRLRREAVTVTFSRASSFDAVCERWSLEPMI